MIRAPRVAPRFICKACGAESPRGIGYVVGIVGPLPAADPACLGMHTLDAGELVSA